MSWFNKTTAKTLQDQDLLVESVMNQLNMRSRHCFGKGKTNTGKNTAEDEQNVRLIIQVHCKLKEHLHTTGLRNDKVARDREDRNRKRCPST